jgi:uncharacterized protein YcnI
MRLTIFAAALALTAPAFAHVTVWPKESSQGAREKYEIRVPNEKKVDTVAVEVRFPAGLRVTSIEQKPEWRTEPLRDASGNLVGARWTGKLAPEQFTEFGILAVNPAKGSDLVWTAIQAYADGSKVEWSGAAGSKTPAPRVTLGPAR